MTNNKIYDITPLLGKIHNCDCLDFMRQLPDKCIDLVLTDPPYGVNLEYGIYKDTPENWDKMFLSLIPELKRISKMSILPSCQIKKLPFIYNNYPPDWLICWYKGSPGHASYIGFNDWEPLLVYGKNTNTMHDYMSVTNTEKMGGNGHPCPKNETWAKWLISRASQEGQIIFDPFMGSGTTAVACERLGRKWFGCELEPKYCEIANKRIEAEMAQLKLF